MYISIDEVRIMLETNVTDTLGKKKMYAALHEYEEQLREKERNAVDIQMCDDVLTIDDVEELYNDEPFITIADAMALEEQWSGTIDSLYDGEY